MFDFVGLLGDFGKTAEEQQRLVIAALEGDRDDALNAYLISACELRLAGAEMMTDLGADLQSVFASGDLHAVSALIEEIIARLEDLEDRWQQVSPPPEAEELHERQLELSAQAIAAERHLLTAFQEQDETALLEANLQVLEFGVEGSRLAADWDELLIEVLSR